MEARVMVKLSSSGVLDVVGIVRKEMLRGGRLVWKACLSRTGEWVVVGEGEPYPEKCWVPVVLHDDEGEVEEAGDGA